MATTPTLRLSVLDQSPVAEGHTPAEALANSLDLAQHVDRLGYTRLWYSEHHAMAMLACTAPELLIARAAAATSRIRVGSGGIMLPHYSAFKVAELFRTLHAMFPGRIDLGIGRAPGGGYLESTALRRVRTGNVPDDFPNQLAELQAYLHPERFPEDHPFRNLLVSPAAPGSPDLWLLGSSMWSSVTAAAEGLPYAFAHFFSAQGTRQAIQFYQRNFQPYKIPTSAPAPGQASGGSSFAPRRVAPTLAPEPGQASGGPSFAPQRVGSVGPHTPSAPGLDSDTWVYRQTPEATIAIGVICAPTQEEADHLHASVRLLQRRIRSGDRRPVATPEDALQQLHLPAINPNPLLSFTAGSFEDPDEDFPRYVVGTPDRVATRLHEIARELEIHELIVNTITHSHAARLRSYTLLAQAMGLPATLSQQAA